MQCNSVLTAHSHTNKHIHHLNGAGEANEIRVHTNLSTYFHKLHQIRRIAVDGSGKAVGCLVTFWLNASHAPTSNRSFRFSFQVLWWLVSALIKFYGIFELHKSNSVPVHNHENMESSRKRTHRNENLVYLPTK